MGVHALVRDDDQVGIALVAQILGVWESIGGVAGQDDNRVGGDGLLAGNQQRASEWQPGGCRQNEQDDDEAFQAESSRSRGVRNRGMMRTLPSQALRRWASASMACSAAAPTSSSSL